MSSFPLLVMTGSRRGIGKALFETLSPRYEILELVRSASKPEHVEWDLAQPLSEQTKTVLTERLKGKSLQGVLLCAGELGPIGWRCENAVQYASELARAMRVNCTSGIELIQFLLPHFVRKATLPAFAFHLSSGAATHAYVGWEAYCISKAAMLMAFRSFAKGVSWQELTFLSVAPGTVMTDMMKHVLSLNPKDFPSAQKFKDLEKNGGLATAESVAEKISLLLQSASWYEKNHGEFYDVRSQRPDT